MMRSRFTSGEAIGISHRAGQRLWQLVQTIASIGFAVAILALSFRIGLPLPTVVSLEILLVVLVTLRWGLLSASAVSVVAVLGLDYLFIPPIYKFSVSAPADWISLFTFESTALLVSFLSAKVRSHAADAEVQRSRTAMLYELSQAILLIDRQQSRGAGLAEAIRQTATAEKVYVWDVYTVEPKSSDPAGDRDRQLAIDTYRAGTGTDDYDAGLSTRVLRIGATSIGALVLRGWTVDPSAADAVASLAAVAVERARSLEREARAEAARETEQLRAAVLDGLAHGFKTPLTAILTGSSGLLAIGGLSGGQAELVSLIDHEARNLNDLTSRLLRTAALDSQKFRLNVTRFGVRDLLDDVVASEKASVRDLIAISLDPMVDEMMGDWNLIRLALSQLIDNAAKYSEVGSTIEIGARQEGSEMVIKVENTGPAIPQKEREKIFERFYRGSDAVHGPAGTGLGLAVVKKIAEAHHGSATVECAGGKTVFFLTLHNAGRNES